ncbi:MAG: hypothetical protein EXS06_02655 [Planctomycetaceae bacterium]|nr:hypothetical protein [Planctomycetaceae bacterium]
MNLFASKTLSVGLAAAGAALALKADPKTRRLPPIVMIPKCCLQRSDLKPVSGAVNRVPPQTNPKTFAVSVRSLIANAILLYQVAACSCAGAELIAVSNRDTTPRDSVAQINPGNTVADKFVITGTGHWTPISVTWDFLSGGSFGTSPPSPANPVVSIYLPDGQYGYIGTLVASSNTISSMFSYDPWAARSYVFSGFQNISIGPGTYWMALTNVNPSDYFIDARLASYPLVNTGTSGYNAESASQTYLWSLEATPTSSVPEIDPGSFGSALALVLGSLGLFERRRAR